MCGINGFNWEDARKIDSMNASTKHRGPDQSGQYVGGRVSLGHNLLSIRSTSEKSKQPYLKNNSPWVLVYNGQLYNTKKMQRELGSKYKDEELDTALLFGMIEKHGWNFISKIQGMFSVALFNTREEKICLYRDPSGQKNLYYYYKDGVFIFSSEIKGILNSHSVDMSIDEEAVAIATSLGYIPGNKTLFKYIHKLNLSEIISFDIRTKKISNKIYTSHTEDYYVNTTNVFTDLVTEHLQGREKTSLNLSGGLDSSILLHEMSGLENEVSTYTNFFENAPDIYNEDALLARKLSKKYSTRHTEINITKKKYLENLIDAYSAIEEPNYNISNPSYLCTAKIEGLGGDGNRVILSGDGGDELFGGYEYYLKNREMEYQQAILTSFIFNIIKNKRNKTCLNFNNSVDRWFFFKDFYKKYLLTPQHLNTLAYLHEITKELFEVYGIKKGFVYECMLMDRFIWLGGENFIRSDKLYMSQSVELRSPFAFPPLRTHFDKKLTVNEYIDKEVNKKYIRKLYDGVLPDFILKKEKKTGWRNPLEFWYDPEIKNKFLEIISDVESNKAIVDWKEIRKIIERSDSWPGKNIHIYLSIAILSRKFRVLI